MASPKPAPASSLARWEQYVLSVSEPMWALLDGRLVMANSAAVKLFGATGIDELLLQSGEVEIAGLSLAEPGEVLLHRNDGSSVRVRLAAWAAPSLGLRLFQAVETDPASGEIHWAEQCIAPAPGDVAASENDELRRGMVSSTADCIKILGLDGRLLYMSPGGRKLMAVTDPATLEGVNWLDFWQGPYREQASQSLAEARAGRAGRFTGLGAKMTGEKRWWDVVLTPLRNAQGAIQRVLSVSRDVTEIKQAHKLESAERSVLEAVATADRPIYEIFDAICKLAELSLAGAARCSLLSAEDDTGDEFCVVASPAAPELRGETINWRQFASNPAVSSGYLQRVGAIDWAEHPVSGGERGLLGRFLLWRDAPQAELNLPDALRTCTSLAAMALTRHSLTRRLRDKRNRLAAISRAAPVGLYQLDTATGRWSFSNERHAQMTGLSCEQASGEGWLSSVHPDDRQSVLDAWRTARAQDSEFTAEYRLAVPEGQAEKWVIAQEASAGEDAGRLGTITDVTEFKRAMAGRAEAAERFETLANHITQFCWMADASGWVFWYNERWYQYTGTTLEQMQGWGWRKVHHPDHVDRVVAKISICWQTGELWEDIFPLRSKDGVYRWFLSRALPIRESNGRITRWFGTNTDVTEQRELETALHEQNLALQRSNQDLSRFAFFASHDLQEPLRAITSYAQLAQRDAGPELGEKSSGHLAVIVDAARRMDRLIRDMLLYAQTSAETDNRTGVVRVERVAASVIAIMQPAIRKAEATVTVGELPEVVCNEAHLAQVLQNLLSNALKYRRPGVSPRVHIYAVRQGTHWRICMQDNGQGFEPEYAERIFEFLKRLHGRGVSGSGIGLAICKTLIERNGGAIGAEGKVGEGSTFWFTLRAVEEAGGSELPDS